MSLLMQLRGEQIPEKLLAKEEARKFLDESWPSILGYLVIADYHGFSLIGEMLEAIQKQSKDYVENQHQGA